MVFEKKMEALPEELNLDHHHERSAIIKGKRTKRPRQYSAATSTSSTTSGEISLSSSEEDQDMANCLILLAQGIRSPAENRAGEEGDLDCERAPKREKIVNSTTTGSDSYECKTCNRTFPSFQALGGHRASHKKPKITPTPATQEKQSLDYDHHQKVETNEEKEIEFKVRLINKISSTTLSNKVHECSICGAEFSSGQALGGHMRRHRSPAPPTLAPANNEEDIDQKKKSRKLLQLDLNLPAPVEDDKFQYISPKMVFSGPTLVGCLY